MPRPVLDPEQLVRRRRDPRQRVGLAAATLLGVSALATLVWAMRAPATVDEVTIVNDTPYDVHVDVRGPGGPVLGLGTVPRGRSISFTTVLDQGDRWSFTFTAGGRDGGTVEVSRDDLEREGWTLAVPATVASRLEGTDLPPSPATRAP